MRARASITDASSVLGEQPLAFSMSRLPLAASCRTGCPCRACIRMMKGRAVCRSIQAQCARAYVEWTTRQDNPNPGTAAATVRALILAQPQSLQATSPCLQMRGCMGLVKGCAWPLAC